MWRAFQNFDHDRCGYISVQELREAFISQGASVSERKSVTEKCMTRVCTSHEYRSCRRPLSGGPSTSASRVQGGGARRRL